MLRYLLPFLLTASAAWSGGLVYTSAQVRTSQQGGAHLDAFGRQRTAAPFTVFDSKEIEGSNARLWDETTAGGASIAHNANQASHSLTLGTASGDKATRQTKRYFQYEPGKSMLILMTGILGAGKANVEQRLGYFDDDNGLFFENANGLRFVRRTKVTGSAVDNNLAQADWDDPLDGSGPSGFTIDLSKTQIYFVDFEWLGVGAVRFGVFNKGRPIVAHQFNFSNSLTEVYMSTPVLPVRYEIENTGTAGSGTTLTQICSSVQVEGGYEPAGVIQSVGTGDSAVGTVSAGTLTPLVSVRVDSDAIRSEIVPVAYSLSTEGAGDYRVEVIIGGTLGGASWSDVPGESIAEIDTSSTTVTGGTTIAMQFVTGQTGQSTQTSGEELASNLQLGATKAGVSDILTLAIYPITDTSVTGGVLRFREVR